MKKALAILLAAAFCLTLAACGGPAPAQPAPTAAPAQDGALTVSLPEGEQVFALAAADGEIWVTAASRTGGAADRVYILDPASGAPELIYSQQENTLRAVWPALDGSLWVLTDAGQGQALARMDRDGTALAGTDLRSITTGGDAALLFAVPTDDGGLLCCMRSGPLSCSVTRLGADGVPLWAQPAAMHGQFFSLTRLTDGSVIGGFSATDAAGEPQGGALVRVDVDTGAVTELPVNGELQLAQGLGAPTVYCGDGQTLWLHDGAEGDVLTYDMAAGTLTRRFNWVDLGLLAPEAVFLRDGALWAAQGGGGAVQVLPVPADGDERTALTLAAIEPSWYLRQAAAAFNRENGAYRVEIKDYGEDGLEQFFTALTAGTLPDMFGLDLLPYDTLRKQGLLLDLTGYIDGDPDIQKEDYVNSMWDAVTVDGRALSLVWRYTVFTQWADPAMVTAEAYTPDAFIALAQGDEPLFAAVPGAASRLQRLEQLLEADLSRFVDWDAAACRFDSPDFIALLEAVKNAPAADALGPGGETLLTSGGGAVPARYAEQFEKGLVPVGEPTADGGRSTFCPRGELAIAAGTAHADGCWQFLRTFLLDETQDAAAAEGLPVQRAALVRRAENGPDLYGEAVPSDAAMEDLFALLDGPMAVSRYVSDASDVIAVVSQLAEPYFGGQATAEDAAADIQSRVSLYLAEHS